MSFLEVTVNREMSSVPQDRADSGGCPAGGFGRRSVLQGVAAAGLAGVGGTLLGRGNIVGRGARPNDVAVETAATTTESSYPFYGEYQSGIITPPPPYRQQVGTHVVFDVTAANRGELTDLFRTLTAQAAFLTAGGTAPVGARGLSAPGQRHRGSPDPTGRTHGHRRCRREPVRRAVRAGLA